MKETRRDVHEILRATDRLRVRGRAITEAVLAELEAAADEIVAAQKERAPKKSGRLAASIRRSKVRKTAKQAKIVIAAGGRATRKRIKETSTVPGRKGRRKQPGGKNFVYDYAVEQEFGNQHMPANPFFYPVIREKSADIRARIRKAFRDEARK